MIRLLSLFLFISVLHAEEMRIAIDAVELCYDSLTHKTHGTDVTLTLVDGSKLICRKAEVDTKSRQGVATAGLGGEPVVYSGLYEDGKGEKRPFLIQAQKMSVALEPEVEITAEGNVQVSYDEQVSAFGERATYVSGKVITLSGDKARISHKSGVELAAAQFLLDPREERVEAQALKVHVPHHVGGVVFEGAATYGIWLRKEKRFIFPQGLSIAIPGEAHLATDGKVEITLDGDEEHPLLKKIVSDGTALVTGEKGQKLLCPGKVLFIPGQRRLEAKAYEGKEIAFEDRTGKFQADYARLQFAEPIAELKVDKAMLKGRVRLSGLVFLPESFSQVALADEVRLDVPAKKAIFKSSEIQPVLYFDPQQNVQISAPKVVASLKEDGTVSAQGKGTVRFKFTGAELDLLRLPGK